MRFRIKFTKVPWTKLRLRMYLILVSSKSKIRWVTRLNRLSSWLISPRLLISSMLRRDSVVAPASSVVWLTIPVWTALILRLKKELKTPKRGMDKK